MPATRPAPAAAPRKAAPTLNADGWARCGLALAVLLVYLPPGLLAGGVLFGADAFTLHARRLEFARDHLFGPSPSLPGWYPRELLGTPFWSNLQNFPLIPTRLPLLLVDPWGAHGLGTNLAAILAATFTYLWCKRLGLGRTGSAVAGWTFACSGFFSSRVMAGHLPLLEAYCGLPLLLWLIERHVASDSPRSIRARLLALGLAAGALMLAGHPQLPIYAISVGAVYLLVRGSWRKALMGVGAIGGGIGCASFALYPMSLLVGRSTRVLALAPPVNDIWFPVWRLKVFVMPWADVPADRYVRWDTDCYVGLLPVVAVLFLLVGVVRARRLPRGPMLFLATAALLALLTAFPRPWAGAGRSWTLLRSPARQAYVTVFGLSVAAGVALDALLRARRRLAPRRALLLTSFAVILVMAHGIDLKLHAVPYVVSVDRPMDAGVPEALQKGVGDGRLAMDSDHIDAINRRLDDVGVFDSILLARPYLALLALAGAPADTNTQLISGAELGRRALEWSGTRMVVTTRSNLDLPRITRGETLSVYSVPMPLPRAGFVPATATRYADDQTILREFRSGAAPGTTVMFLPPSAMPKEVPKEMPSTAPTPDAASATYRRPDTDRIEVTVHAPTDGFLRVLETFDPGWSATVDGRRVELLPGDSFVCVVPVAAGTHEMRMTYHTPGAATGLALSAAACVSLAGLVWAAPRLAPTRRHSVGCAR